MLVTDVNNEEVARTSGTKKWKSAKDETESYSGALNNEEMKRKWTRSSLMVLSHKFLCVKLMVIHREFYLMHLRQFFIS